MLAKCPHCGTIFMTQGVISGADGAQVTSKDNSTTCIKCGKMANILDGVWEYKNGRPFLVDGPPESKETFAKFIALMQ